MSQLHSKAKRALSPFNNGFAHLANYVTTIAALHTLTIADETFLSHSAPLRRVVLLSSSRPFNSILVYVFGL